MDNGLIYLNDVGPSHLAALQVFDTFGSGIQINWSKSIFFPIDDQAIWLGFPSQLDWVEEF